MSLFYSILLGIIQGITEFLPVSSTAHLTIAGTFLHLINNDRPEEWTAFIAVIQIGTMAAVIIYFFKDLVEIVEGFFVDGVRYVQSPSNGLGRARMGWYIILGTLPVAVIGLAFRKIIEGTLTKSLTVIGISAIVLALILWLAERVGSRKKEMANVTWLDSLIVGFAQSLGADSRVVAIRHHDYCGLVFRNHAFRRRSLFVPSQHSCGICQRHAGAV
jgi:undecaprenyl-diphosphatase